MPHGGDGALDHENIRAGFLGDLAVSSRLLRDGTDGGGDARVLDLADAGRDEIFLDGFLVNFLQQAGDLVLVGFERPCGELPAGFCSGSGRLRD